MLYLCDVINFLVMNEGAIIMKANGQLVGIKPKNGSFYTDRELDSMVGGRHSLAGFYGVYFVHCENNEVLNETANRIYEKAFGVKSQFKGDIVIVDKSALMRI